eukprot:evm.model.scf_1022.3 EVM.evm.TU.scf_1022.3   scf_1022:34401-39582(-)
MVVSWQGSQCRGSPSETCAPLPRLASQPPLAYAADYSNEAPLNIARTRILLVDALDPLYRVHYGYNDRLHNQAGEETTLIHGFLAQFFGLMDLRPPPTHCAVVFDFGGKTFRDEIFPAYKQNRPETPMEIVEAVPKLKDLLSRMGVRWVSVPGVEADDVIGTLAVKASEAGMEVYIVSRDKDFFQLLSPSIRVLRGPMKDGMQLYTESRFREENGVEPSQWVEVLGLMGDLSDNIPGVKNVGLKTARLLIKEYGSIEEVLSNAHEVKRRSAREQLESEAGQNAARLSKELVTIHTRLDMPPLRYPIHDYSLKTPPDGGQSAIEAFESLELKTQMGSLRKCLSNWSRRR